MASFNHSWLSSPLSEPPTFFLSPSPQPKPFKLSVLRNKSSSILNSSSPDRSPEVEVVVDPVKLALKKAEAYKKSKAEQKTPERNTDDEEVPLTVKLAKQKADEYKKLKELGADGVHEANKPSSVKTISLQTILGTNVVLFCLFSRISIQFFFFQ